MEAGPRSFQPMNINFGLFPPLDANPTRDADGNRLRGAQKTVAKKQVMAARALADMDGFARANADLAGEEAA